MSTFNDGGAGEEIKQGKYANGLILLLISLLGVVASYFSYQLGQSKTDYKQSKQEDKIEQEEQREREDKIREMYQSKLDQREQFHEHRYRLLQMRADSLSDYLVDVRIGRAKSEFLASESKKTAKSFQAEVRKTVDVTKQLDSVSNSVSKSLQQ